MKYHKQILLIFSIILILILSCGMVSAAEFEVGNIDSISSDANDIDISDSSIDVDLSDSSIDVDLSDSSIDVDLSDSSDESSSINLDEKVKAVSSNMSAPVSGKTFEDIQKAIDNADKGDTIELSGTYIGNGNGISINRDMTIQGDGSVVLDAKGLSSIVTVLNYNTKVTLKNINFKNSLGTALNWTSSEGYILNCNFINCYASSRGGAIYCDGMGGSILNCSFVNCSASERGGAIFWDNYYGSLLNCSFVNCSASEMGGAIFWDYKYSGLAVFNCANCSFVDCDASYNGGAMYISEYYQLNLANSSFLNCKSNSSSGGAISGSPYVSNCSFVNCSASESGGAINCGLSSRYSFVFNSSFLNCSSQEGGAVHRVADVLNCSFVNCSSNDGGAVYWAESIVNSSFINNSAFSYYNEEYDFYEDGFGGAVYHCLNVLDSTFINNSACSGGAVYYVNAMNCVFINNHALAQYYNHITFGGYGGAVGSAYNLINCNFTNNSASNEGGAAYTSYDSSRNVGNFSDYVWSNVINCSFINNSARYGGAISYDVDREYDELYGDYFDHYRCDIVNCSFVNNSALNQYVEASGYYSGGYGGAINNANEVRDCNFSNNIATYSGGAIDNAKEILHCSFINNSALGQYFEEYDYYSGGYGGAISTANEVANCSFTDNFARSDSIIAFDSLDSYSENKVRKYFTTSELEKPYYHTVEFKTLGGIFDCNLPENALNNYYDIELIGSELVLKSLASDDFDLILKISDKKYDPVYKKDYNGYNAYFDLSDLSEGNYSANIKLSNSTYVSKVLTTYCNIVDITVPIVIKTNFALSSSNVSKFYGGAEKYTVTLTKNNNPLAGEKVQITINNKTSTLTTNSKGQASVDLNLTPGTYEILSSYKSISLKSKLTVKSTVSISNYAGTYLNSKVSATFLNASGKALANTKVSFKVGPRTYTASTDKKGVAIASIDLGVGTYNVTAINPINNEPKTSKLTISKAKSTMTLSSTSNNGVVTLTASLSPSTTSGNVTFNIDDKNYTAKVNNSKAIQTITDLNTGNYTVKANYSGDNNLNSSSASTKVSVKKAIPTKIIYEDMKTGIVPKSEGRIGNYFCVKLVDDKDKAISGVPIKIGFNGVIYNRTTNTEGGARLQINLVKEDLYTFAICFLGDDDYQAAFEVAKINVSKSYPKPNKANSTTTASSINATQHESRLKTYINYSNMDTKSVLKVEGRVGKYFVVKLLDNNKKALADAPIKIGFNGVIYNRTTNATGEAKLQINLLKPTLYTFAISYLGDSKYQASFEVAKITVKAQTPKLTSSSKTFKASAKTKSLSAKLISERGTPISGQKVTFTVNGKTYTGKTNAKGVATVNISLNKKGTYSCTVKFAGIAGASAKSTKISVKIS